MEWPTLVFFIALFMVIAGAEETGLIQVIAGWLQEVSRGNLTVAIVWSSAIFPIGAGLKPAPTASCFEATHIGA